VGAPPADALPKAATAFVDGMEMPSTRPPACRITSCCPSEVVAERGCPWANSVHSGDARIEKLSNRYRRHSRSVRFADRIIFATHPAKGLDALAVKVLDWPTPRNDWDGVNIRRVSIAMKPSSTRDFLPL
jgi:hypothetical protein